MASSCSPHFARISNYNGQVSLALEQILGGTPISCIMAFKRARAEAKLGDLPPMVGVQLECADEIRENGLKFRRLLIERYLEGNLPASDIGLLAYYHTQSGGQGSEDLAVHPSQCSKHGSQQLRSLSFIIIELYCLHRSRFIASFAQQNLRSLLQKEFPEPHVEWIPAPMCCKKSIDREVVLHPTRVTSDMIREELQGLGLLGSESNLEEMDGACAQDAELGDLFFQHPVTVEARNAGFRWEHIVPLSVYFDGVQYSKNENFLGFYCTNLRTKKQRLVWLLRNWVMIKHVIFYFVPNLSIPH